MKNRKILLTAVLLSMMTGCSFFNTSSSPSTSLSSNSSSSSLEVSSSGEKQASRLEVTFTNGGTFILNDEFSEDLLRVYVYYEDGSKEVVAVSDCTYTKPDLTTAGKQVFTVTYNGLEASCDIFVYEVYTFNTSYNGANDTAPDKEFLHEISGTGRNDKGYRFADEKSYWTYKFQLNQGMKYKEMIFKGLLSNEFLISVSLDNINWQDLAQGGVGPGNRMEDIDVNINFNDDFINFAENHGTIYFRIKDANEADGFGAILQDFKLYYIQEVDENPVTPETPVESANISFNTASADETEYLHSESGSGTVENTKRWADQNAYFIYKFDLGKSISKFELNLTIENESKIEVSYDGEQYYEIANSIKENANGCGKYFSNVINKFDVEAAINTGVVYIRFSDAKPEDGFGCCLYSFSMTYFYGEGKEIETPSEPETPIDTTSVSFVAASADEAKYLHAQEGSGSVENTKRWADQNAYFIYKFDLGKSVSSIKLDLVIENDTKIEISYDGENYVEFANSLTENANGCGRYFGNVTNTFNIETTTNTGVVYIRFSDAKPEDGFGCCLYSFSMEWVYGEGKEVETPSEPAEVTSLSFKAASADEAKYLHAQEGSGSVENDRRWADQNAYYIYKFDLGKSVSSIKLDLVIENDTKIEISYDGENYVEFANSLTENANGCGRYFGNVTNTFNIETTTNTGVVYIRFSDAKPEDGFGCCLYSFSMEWVYGEGKEVETPSEPAEVTSLSFKAASADEAKYLHAQEGSGSVENDRRWADQNAYYIYKFDLGKSVSSIKLDLVIENDTKIEISYDGENYVEFANSLTENANGCGRYFGNVTNTFNIETTTNTGVVYIRFSDAKPEDGFGCCLYSFSMEWKY